MQNFGIYIHIPFCQRKCKYCDFISFDKCDENMQKEYINSLLKEIENYKTDKKITTIYIGGGTPSIFPAEYIGKVIKKINEQFEVLEDAEITIEINPGTVDFSKLQMYKEIGINRLSIGLQSTQNRLLEIVGRIHKYEDFLETYKNARKIRV